MAQLELSMLTCEYARGRPKQLKIEVSDAVRRLLERRRELQDQMRPRGGGPGDPGPGDVPFYPSLAVSITNLFYGWHQFQFQSAQMGHTEGPSDTDGTRGQVQVVDEGSAGFDLSFNLWTVPEALWLRTWTQTAVFPPAPADGFLHVRGSVGVGWEVYKSTGMLGGIHSWADLGMSRDAAAVDPLSGSALEALGTSTEWIPLNSNFFGYELKADRRIRVNAGDRSTAVLLCGAAVDLQQGRSPCDTGPRE